MHAHPPPDRRHRHAPTHRGGGAGPRQDGHRWAPTSIDALPEIIELHDDEIPNSDADNPVPDLETLLPFLFSTLLARSPSLSLMFLYANTAHTYTNCHSGRSYYIA